MTLKRDGVLSESAPNVRLVSARSFECRVFPSSNSITGTLIPRVLHKAKRRIISIEVYNFREQVKDNKKTILLGEYEECYVRVLSPDRTNTNNADENVFEEIDNVSRMDESTLISPEYLDAGNEGNDSYQKEYPGWIAKYRFPMKTISIKGTNKKSVTISIDLGRKRDVREILFDTIAQAEDFENIFNAERQLDAERTEARMKVAMGINQQNIRLDERMDWLVEIVSGWDLPVADLTSSDPFVSCLIDGKEIHRTDFISKTLDPIWTVSTGSLFLLSYDVKYLFRSDGLLLIVYDFDKLGANDRLGAITIPPKTIYDAKGERMEFKLGPPPGKTTEVSGYLAVRIRRATEYDKNFMADLKKFREGKGVINTIRRKPAEIDETASKGGKGNIHSMISRRSRIAKSGPNAGKREYKIRPVPDPTRIEETTWMTKEALEAECMKESTRWIDAGTGRLGRIFVEILGCDDLPNMDTGGFAGNKTDAFVCAVFEDAVVQTDVVDDTLTPRWMPWTKRAFIFHIYHSSSQLFLGVFDYDQGINPTDDHDLIGRVSVDLSNLRKNTMYTLTYNIYTTARMTLRKQMGTITLRLRIEIDDERKVLLSTLEPPPQMYVNVKTRKEFRVVRYTCTGKYNMEKYSMKVINSYIEELLSLQHIVFYVQDALTALILWRGTLEIKVPFSGRTVWFPVHSLTAFLVAIFLVEKPQLIPCFFFIGVGWLLLAAQAYRRSLPDLWSRCKSFPEFVEALIFGESKHPPDSIRANENDAAARAFLEAWQKRIADAEEAAAKAYEEQIRAQEEYEKEMEELGDTVDTDLAAESGGGVSIDPFKSLLFPVQQNLALVCRWVRHVKFVISWQECYIAFWLTVGCFLIALICFFIPWFFIIKWTSRIAMWTVFGPWMKLVDIHYIQKIMPLTEDELERKKQKEREQRYLQTMTAVSAARIKREDNIKLREMKKHMFGKFITRVPVLKEDRYRDLPAPDSHAEPYYPNPIPMSELAMADVGYRKIRLPGQHLVGDMIPKVERPSFTEAPIGQPTAHPKLVDKTRPGGGISSSVDSTAAAYIKLASVVVSAAVLTWFGVPLLASLTERALSYRYTY